MISPKLLAWVIGVALVLLVVVIVVGLLRNQIDPTGVATVMATLISGIVVGALVRGKPTQGDGS